MRRWALLASPLAVALIIGVIEVRAGSDLESRSRTLDQRNLEIDQRAAALDARRTALDQRERDLDSAGELQKAESERVASEQIAEWVSIAAANEKLNGDRAAFESERASFSRDFCTVYVAAHDANTTFWGAGYPSACADLEEWLQRQDIATLQGDPSSAGTVCRGTRGATRFEVRDSGGRYSGSRICDALIRWSQGEALTAIAWR